MEGKRNTYFMYLHYTCLAIKLKINIIICSFTNFMHMYVQCTDIYICSSYSKIFMIMYEGEMMKRHEQRTVTCAKFGLWIVCIAFALPCIPWFFRWTAVTKMFHWVVKWLSWFVMHACGIWQLSDSFQASFIMLKIKVYDTKLCDYDWDSGNSSFAFFKVCLV